MWQNIAMKYLLKNMVLVIRMRETSRRIKLTTLTRERLRQCWTRLFGEMVLTWQEGKASDVLLAAWAVSASVYHGVVSTSQLVVCTTWLYLYSSMKYISAVATSLPVWRLVHFSTFYWNKFSCSKYHPHQSIFYMCPWGRVQLKILVVFTTKACPPPR